MKHDSNWLNGIHNRLFGASMEQDHKIDMRESIAYPKAYQPKQHPRKPYARYPHMPLQDGNKPFFDATKNAVVWKDARHEAEWLEAHPKEAELIAMWADEQATVNHRPDNVTQRAAHLEDANKRLTEERNAAEKATRDALEELEVAKAQLRAKRASEDGGKLDMRTKEGRAAAKATAGEA